MLNHFKISTTVQEKKTIREKKEQRKTALIDSSEMETSSN